MNFKRLKFLVLLFVFFSCATKQTVTTTKSILYPAPPLEGRIQFLTRFSTSKDIVKQGAFSKAIVGEEKVKSILKPYGIFVRNGKIYVCDVNIAGMEVFDLKERKFEYFIPKDQYQLKMPLNCFIDKDNTIYVADIELRKIMVYDGNHKYITSFGLDENVKPTDVFLQNNKVWVVDSGNHRINVYDKKNNEFKYFFPKAEIGDEEYLFKPTNIFVSENEVYVTDMAASNVKVFTHEGKLLRIVGKYGDGLGDFVRPKGLAVDKESNLYVVDASFENIQIFNKKGDLLLFFGGSYKGPGGMWLPVKVRIDYEDLEYFQKYVDPDYELEYLIFVTNQFGPDKVSVYGRVHKKKV